MAKEQRSPHQRSLFGPAPQPWDEDDAAEQLLAEVVVIDGPPEPLTYLVPERLREQLAPGMRVTAPLGGSRVVTGYCVGLETGRREYRLRPLSGVLDAAPLLNSSLLKLTAWMSEYYLCGWADAIEAAVPAGVRSQAGTRERTYLRVDDAVGRSLDELRLPPKQRAAMERLAASARPLTPQELADAVGCSLGPVQALRQKKLVREERRRVYTAETSETPAPRGRPEQLNPAQQQALRQILAGVDDGRCAMTLVHGVTGSGKTEVYIRAIDEVIQHGKQAIVLVPEISLTPQTRQRFRSRFDRVAVLHSHLSPPERYLHWQRIASGEVQVVVGARSAVFAPTKRLGLIVLDEEHDGSFKQDSPAPRYHAREVAMWRARNEQAALVLGSATPSLESWQRAQDKHYQLVSLPDRVLDLPLPDVGVVDLRQATGPLNRGAISRVLRQSIDQALKNDGQVILLLNRRGYSTNIQCTACGEAVCCPHCEISLTHHLQERKARCHYCDYETAPPMSCPNCGFEGIRYSGLGTQKLEMEVRGKFPDHACIRMDSDTMRKHGSHEAALQQFREGQADILLGTQMIAKGLDFPNVTLVGVINADTALHFPDFRAAERTFQLVTQVAGRTGRGAKGGRVLVQTYSPEHPAIAAAQRHDYEQFAAIELPLRRQFGYPPFAAMARIIVRGPGESLVVQVADALAERLQAAAPSVETRILGPAAAPLPKLQGRYRYHILITCPDRPALRQMVQSAAELTPGQQVQFAIDMDPTSML